MIQAAAALAAHQQLADIPCLTPQLQHTPSEHQTSSTDNQDRTHLKEEPSGELSSATDVGVSLSQMLLLRERTDISSPAHHQLPIANSRSSVIPATAIYPHSDIDLAPTVETKELHDRSPRIPHLQASPVDLADIAQSPRCQQSDDIPMEMSPRQPQVADPGQLNSGSLDAGGAIPYAVTTFDAFEFCHTHFLTSHSLSNKSQQLQREGATGGKAD